MRALVWTACAAALTMLVAEPLWAQQQRQQRQPGRVGLRQPGGFGFGFGAGAGLLMYLGQESVQKELKMTEEQVSKVRDLQQKQRAAFKEAFNLSPEERRQKMRELTESNTKALAEILKPEQLKRLKQINYQLAPLGGVLSDPEVQKELNLSDEQKEKIRAIQQDAAQAMRELFQPGGDPNETRRKIEEFRKSTDQKLMNLLTDAQKNKLNELKGEPFKGEIRFRPPGGGQGRPPATGIG